MEREALLNIIINDLKEVDLLMNTFKSSNSIDVEFLQLSMVKINQITVEMKMLEKFVGSKQVAMNEVVSPTITEVAKPVVVIEKEKPFIPPVEPESVNVIEEPTITECKEDVAPPVIVTINEAVVALVEEPPVAIVEEKIAAPIIEVKGETLIVIEENLIPEPIVAKVVEEVDSNPEFVAPVIGFPVQSAEVKEVVENKEPAVALKEDKHILKDILASNKKSVNEIISEKKVVPPSMGQNIVVPVANIYKAIGINDKMLFQRELFGNNGAKMNTIIDQLNVMQSMDDAVSFLKSNFDWNFDDERVVAFLNIVKRRYL